MTQLWKQRHETKDFTLLNKDDESHLVKVHLFVLIARSLFFSSVASSPMLEMQNFVSKFSLKSLASGKSASKRVFDMFLKYLYLGESHFLVEA